MTGDARRDALRFSGRLRSVRFALAGVATMLRTQANAWVHLAATAVVVAVGLWLDLPPAVTRRPGGG